MVEVGGTRQVALLCKKVLVADADEIVLALIAHILNRQGYVVDPVGSTAEAAALLRERSYSAALIDPNMPGAGTAWLRAILEDIPALHGRVVLIGVADADPDLPIHSVMRKPIEFGLLIEAVADCVTEPD